MKGAGEGMKPFWPLAMSTWGQAERDAAHAVIDSGDLTMGRHVREFEAAFADYVGSKYAVMVNSGSSANLLAASVLRHGRVGTFGDFGDVAVPAIAWSTTYSPFSRSQLSGCSLRVFDIDPTTVNVGRGVVTRARYEGIRLAVGVSILGYPAPLREMRALCDMLDVPFMEDNCESFGARVGKKFCGTFGDVGTFSLFFSHHISTGEGGMLVTDRRDLYELAVCMRAHGWTRDLPPNSPLRPLVNNSMDYAYNFIMPGFNIRPTELAAAVGLVQLRRAETLNMDRRENANLFNKLFANDSRWTIQREGSSDDYSVPFGFVLVFRTPEDRGKASVVMSEVGIAHRLVTGGSFGKHPAAHYYYCNPSPSTPNADHVHDCGLFVGNHPTDLTEHITGLRALLEEALK